MPSTFGCFWVHADDVATHTALSVPRGVDAANVKRMQYSGPRVIMPEKIADFDKWLKERKSEGFVMTSVD